MLFKRSDFVVEVGSKPRVECVNPLLVFNRPSRLTKWDLACVLADLQPSLHWCMIYDAFTHAQLVDLLIKAFDNVSAS